MTAIQSDPEVEPQRAVPALTAAILSLPPAFVALHLVLTHAVRPLATWPLAIAAVLAIVTLFAARRGPASIGLVTRIGFALAAGAWIAIAAVEQPPWPSIESFGNPSATPWLTAFALLPFAIGFARRRGEERAGDALALYALLAAFGGAMFVRDGDTFAALHSLFAVALILLLPGRATPFLAMPFARPLALLALLTAVTAISAVDLPRHLSGVARLMVALLPLAMIARVTRDESRKLVADRVLFAVTVAGGAGALAALAAIVESGFHFDAEAALRSRLPLFGEHPNIVATFFAVIPPLLLAALRRSETRLARAAILLAGVAILGALLLTRSRTSVFAALCGIAFTLIAGWLGEARGAALKRRSLSLGLVLLLAIAGGFAARGKLAAVANDPSMAFRFYLWRTAAAAIEERPLLGHGFLTAAPLMANAEPSDLDGRSKDTHPHSLPIAFALGAGLPAASLFLLLWLVLIARLSRLTRAATTSQDRALASGVAGSAVALLLATLLDQGLAIDTPFPPILGVLFALGASLELTRRGAAPAIEPRRGLPRILPLVPLAAIAIIASLDAVVVRSVEAARDSILRHRPELALRAASIAAAIPPLRLDALLTLCDALDANGDRPGAAELIARHADRFPLAAEPWERLSELEYDRRQYEAAYVALSRARERDPTGPLMNRRALRAANLANLLGRRAEAHAEFSAALRYDPTAIAQIQWLIDDETKEFFVPMRPGEPPLTLAEILEPNHRELPHLIATDIVDARRVATSLARIWLDVRRFDRARAIIDEWRDLTDVRWGPLEYLATEIERAEVVVAAADTALVAAAVPEPDADQNGDDPGVEPAARAIEGDATQFLAEGRRLLALSDLDGANAAFETAIDQLYDLPSERHYIGDIVEGLFTVAAMRGDVDELDRHARALRYLRPSPAHRVDVMGNHANALREAGYPKRAVAALDDLETTLALFAIPRSDSRLRGDSRMTSAAHHAAVTLASLLKDPSAARATETLVAGLRASPAGQGVAALALARVGRAREADDLIRDLRANHPEWLPLTWTGNAPR
jgi:O-antigen ligase/tetratricopeptide (TPR) repeat protein